MVDFVTNIQEYLDAAESAATTPPCELSSSLSPPRTSPDASTVTSSMHRVHPSISNLAPPSPSSGYVAPPSSLPPGSNPNWSAVGGYDHPQPGSRLLQYGALQCNYTVCTLFSEVSDAHIHIVVNVSHGDQISSVYDIRTSTMNNFVLYSMASYDIILHYLCHF